MSESADIVVIGAGAAGLMAAITAGREGSRPRILAVDGARTLGAKILVSGGGRCNVMHDRADEASFSGSSRPAIRKVLGRFTAERTAAFFSGIGVRLKREEAGKVFPENDSARSVLDALLDAAAAAGVEFRHPWRVESVAHDAGGFTVARAAGARRAAGAPGAERAFGSALRARRVILATGGMSLPKTGSDGHGYALARSLGHSITPRVFPALVPLTLEAGSPLLVLAGVSAEVTLTLRSASGAPLATVTGPLLCTHSGISGPAVLDMSRFWIDAVAGDPRAFLTVNWLPGETEASVDERIRDLGATSPGRFLARRLPLRIARALCEAAGVDPSAAGRRLARGERRSLVRAIVAMRLPVTGHRGFAHAEVTAGGVPLSELRLETMESRVRPGLFLCGEVCDVDGRIGGYNFQWAWSSGHVAGLGAARSLVSGSRRTSS